MKRFQNDQVFSNPRKRIQYSEGSLPKDLLKFSWANDVYGDLKIPINRDNYYTATFESAVINSNISFNESLRSTITHLKRQNIKVCKATKQDEVTPRCLNNKTIAEILNSSLEKSVMTMSSSKSEKVVNIKGRLLAYGICQLYNCKIIIFSTRSHPMTIWPNSNQSDGLPSFHVLEHKSSYLHSCAYYALKPMSKKINRPRVILQSEETTTVVAIKRKDNEKKPVSSRHSLGGALDDLVLQQLDEESSKMYSRKWLKFQNDDKSKKKTLDDFVKTLSTKSIPTGVIPLVKTKVEQLMKDNKIENLTAKNIPTSALWMHHIVEKLKKKGQLTIELLIENFVKMTKSKIQDDREVDDSTENSNFGEVTHVTEEKESIRTVGKTLKGVINPKFDYDELLGRLDQLQHESNLAIFGLSKAIQTLFELLLSGKIQALPDSNGSFRIRNLDYNNDGLGKDEPDLTIISEEGKKVFQDEKIFAYSGFWLILSRCVASKNPHKNTPLIKEISEKMSQEDIYAFTTSPAIGSACKQYYTNFNNMWSEEKYRDDLRVAITLLLRINLARKRYFKHRKPSPQSSTTPSPLKKNKSLSGSMKLLFELLLKFQKSKHRKVHSIEKVVEAIFCGDEKPTVAQHQAIEQDEDEESDDEDEGLVPGSEKEKETDNTLENDRDLTSREIKALVAVVTMLCGSDSIVGTVKPDFVKKQLYLDKQETIPERALVLCSKIVNSLRAISLKKNKDPSFMECYPIRCVRNALVKFSGYRTKFGERRLWPAKDKEHASSIFVDYRSLYLLFCKDYNIVKTEDAFFTSNQEIKNDQDKRMVFENFFDHKTIDRILKEQHLEPSYSFVYSNQYDLNFLGFKTSMPLGQQPTTSNEVETPGPVVDKASIDNDIKVVNSEIKIHRKEYALLLKSIHEEEWRRMDLARSFRKKEKEKQPWDAESYKILKQKRNECDAIYSRLQELNGSIKNLQSKMYLLNKSKRGQKFPSTTNTMMIPKRIEQGIMDGSTLMQGLDPGVVTTAAVSCLSTQTLFESVNRYKVLEAGETVKLDAVTAKYKNHEYTYTAGKINRAVLSTAHRLLREKKQRDDVQIRPKVLQKQAVTRKIRLKRFHQLFHSSQRSKMFEHHQVQEKAGAVCSFVGNWSRQAMYIRGHVLRKLDPILERFNSFQDHACLVDEFRSTITCSSCFQVTSKQLVRVQETKKKRIKGAVTCNNKNCPRRAARMTTINRDMNAAANIALIGFSSLISQENLPLPPFQKSRNETTKYNLAERYQGARMATLIHRIEFETDHTS